MYPFPENRDGTRKIIVNLLRHLPSSSRPDVLTLYQEEDREYFPHQNQFDSQFLKFQYRTRHKFFTLLRWGFSAYPFNAVKFSSCYTFLARELNQIGKNYTGIHLETPFLAPVIEKLLPEIRSRVILFPHDSLSLLTLRRIGVEKSWLIKSALRIDYPKIRNFESRYYPQAVKTVFVSEVDARYAQGLHSDLQAAWIPNGVDTDYFRPLQSESEIHSLVFTGNMDYAPNADAALFFLDQVFPRLRQIHKQIRLYIVGRNPVPKLTKYHNGENIIITGFVEDVREYIDKSALFISPLRFGSGMKNKILEAMAMEKPVVASPVSRDGIEGLEHRKNIVKMEDLNPVTWAETISRLLRNVKLQDSIGKKGRELVCAQYSWPKICGLYHKLYEDCLSH